MKTDWSEMNGFWVRMDERHPPCKGLYWTVTTYLNERCLRWNGERWNLSDNRDYVVYWWDSLTDPKTGKVKPWEPI